MNNQISAICVANTQVREINGLYSLADLHKASGGQNKHRPSLWLRNQQTIEFIEELTKAQICAVEKNQVLSAQAKQALLDDENSLRENVIKVANGGKHGSGTYVCKELVVHYGMWISPEFSIKVIQTFLNSKSTVTETPPTPPTHYRIDVEKDESAFHVPLAHYAAQFAQYTAKAKGISVQQMKQQLIEKFGTKHKDFHEQSKWFYGRVVEWLHEELDKLPMVDFGVSRSDLLNIFKRQCQYKRYFENWNEYQLESWLNEKFFHNRTEHYLGYPTSLESASYAQLENLVYRMKEYLGTDFKLLAMSQQEKMKALPQLHGTDGSIGQVLFNYGANTPECSDATGALQDMATLRYVFDALVVNNYDKNLIDADLMDKLKEANIILHYLSTMLMEATSQTLKH